MAEQNPTDDELAELAARQRAEIERLKRRIEELEEQLRAAHRQAAPFRRREKTKTPPGRKKRPGRKKTALSDIDLARPVGRNQRDQ